MPARLILTILLIGMLGGSAPRAQAAEGQSGTGHPSPGTAAPDATKDLKTSVEALDKDVQGLQASLQRDMLDKDVRNLQAALERYAPAHADRALQDSLYFASVVAIVIAVLLLVGALFLWNATRNLKGLASQNDVNAARDVVRGAVLAGIAAAQDLVRADVAGARADLPLAVNTARDAVLNAVNTTRDGLHTDVAGARDAAHADVMEMRGSLSGTLEDVKAKIAALPH